MLDLKGGGAPKKKGKRANPFDDEEIPEYPTAFDTGHYQSAFTNGIHIGQMTKENIDVKALLRISDAPTLERVLDHLEKGTSHSMVRISDVAEMAPFVASLRRVAKLSENCVEKFKNLMSSKMWDLGVSNGNFKMEILAAYIRGIHDMK